MAIPESWLDPETLEKFGFPGGIILGAVGGVYIAFRIIKSGRLLFGDKAELLVEKARLEIQLENALENLRERDAILAERNQQIAGRDQEIKRLRAGAAE